MTDKAAVANTNFIASLLAKRAPLIGSSHSRTPSTRLASLKNGLPVSFASLIIQPQILKEHDEQENPIGREGRTCGPVVRRHDDHGWRFWPLRHPGESDLRA